MAHFTKKLNFETDYHPVPKNGWYSLGAGAAGALFHPAVSPHDPNVMMICCDMTDTYITYNAGKNWTELNLDGMVNNIVFDPVRPGVIYAGSQALYRSMDNGKTWKLILPSPGTVIKSKFIDEGATHVYETTDHMFEGGRIQKILVDRKNPENIYVGLTKSLYSPSEEGMLRLFGSFDDAGSWQELASPEGTVFLMLEIVENPAENQRKLLVFTDKTYYRYEEGGDGTAKKLVPQPLPNEAEAWEAIEKKKTHPAYMPFLHRKHIFSGYPVKLAAAGIHPDTGASVLYMVCEMRFDEKGKMKSGIYRSFDLGESWTELSGLDVDYAGPDNGQLRSFKDITTSYYHPEKIYLSIWRHPEVLNAPMPDMNYQGILVSNDYGDTWEWSVRMGDSIPDNVGIGWFEHSYDVDWLGAPWYFSVSDHCPDISLAACQGFTWLTGDGGKTWNQVYCDLFEDGSSYGKNLESTTCYDVVFDPFDKDICFITYTDSGLLKSTNGNKTWSHAIKGVPFEWINTCYSMVFDSAVKGLAWGVWGNVHDLPRSKIYANNRFNKPGTASGVCVTEDCAGSWRPTCDGLAEGGEYTCIALDPTSPVGSRTLYVTQCPNGVFKSTDNGKSWVNKTKGMGENKHSFFIKLALDGALYVTTIRTRVDDKNTSADVRALTDGGIYKSTDGAESWRRLELPKNVTFPHKIDVNPAKPNQIYFTSWPTNVDGRYVGGGVYKSEDGGETWKNIFDERARVYGIQVDPKNPEQLYIVTFEFAAFRSLDGGKTWERIRGYNFKWGHNPILDPYNDDMMYITTFGGSVFYGPRAGGNENYDDIENFMFNQG